MRCRLFAQVAFAGCFRWFSWLVGVARLHASIAKDGWATALGSAPAQICFCPNFAHEQYLLYECRRPLLRSSAAQGVERCARDAGRDASSACTRVRTPLIDSRPVGPDGERWANDCRRSGSTRHRCAAVKSMRSSISSRRGKGRRSPGLHCPRQEEKNSTSRTRCPSPFAVDLHHPFPVEQ